MIKRSLKITLSDTNAAFLWGPRKTGKTTLLKQQFSKAKWYDLLNTKLKTRLLKNPSLLREEVLAQRPKIVIVDEIQKVPALLDEIHWCLENTKTKFILCGSSARKLKHGAANLLGGRAWRYELFPLTTNEIQKPGLIQVLNHGLIPQHYLAKKPERFFESYIADYLNEEIQAEALVRNLQAFAQFLTSLSFSHGELINYANLASDCGVSPKTARAYFQILEDTLLGHRLEPWRKSRNRRLIETEKFYLFDVGLVRGLKEMVVIQPKTIEFGKSFEHFLIEEVRACLSYKNLRHHLTYWRTTNGLEVDLIVGDGLLAIEFKASENIQTKHLKGLKAFCEENSVKQAIIVCLEESPRQIGKILLLPWQIFCQKLWEGRFGL